MGLDSQLARFAVKKNHLKLDKMRPKLFQPDKKGKLSVFRIEDKTCEEIKEEGKRVVRERHDTDTLYGWAKIDTLEVHRIRLTVCDDDNPPGHSSIVGWPDNEQETRTYQQKLVEQARWRQLSQPITVA